MNSPSQLKKRKNGRDEDELFYLDDDGKLHGLWRCYGAGGKLKEECNYKHGIFHGLMRSWHTGEKPAFNGDFYEGRPLGTHEAWFSNGKLKHSCIYNEHGLKDGEEFYWRADGNEEYYCKYGNGKRVGRGYYNWPNGRLAMEYFYDSGTEKYYPQNRN
jgi:antitoxin component YwqK of YwqJK toxin-antitoxin module